MQLHDFRISLKKKSQRVGRGGKRGTTSGRGTKGQKSRSGHVIRPAQRDLILRLPKKRGFKNPPTSDRPLALNLSDLRGKVKALITERQGAVNMEVLKDAALVRRGFRGAVKLLGDGGIDFPIVVKGLTVSKSAKIKIEAAGGKVIAPPAAK